MKNLLLLTFTTIILSVSIFAQNDIRKVDFQNFTYSPDYCSQEKSRKITVKDGIFTKETKIDGYTDRIYFNIYKTTYGDLDGDNKDEAIIFSSCNTGGTGNFTEAYIYKMVDGKPSRKMLLVGGDRAYGGLRDARVENGLLVIESNDAGKTGGACCPQNIITSKYKFDGNRLKEIGKTTSRKVYPEERIRFDKGSFSKRYTLKMSAKDQIKRYIIGAEKGQTLLVSKTSDKAKVSLFKGDARILEEDSSLVAKLNKSGDFVFEFSNFTEKELEFNVIVTIKTLSSGSTQNVAGKIESIYTDLDPKKCKTLESSDEDAGFYRGECKGVGNYKLEVLEGDIRQTINVIHKQSGDKWELDFWSKVSNGFSSVGSKAEWRVRRVNGKIRPIALIVRYNVSETQEDGTNKNKSSLVVTKFDGEFVCITDVVPPMKKQNERARQLADVAVSKPCYRKN